MIAFIDGQKDRTSGYETQGDSVTVNLGTCAVEPEQGQA
jgi:hypothetical protein